MCSSDLDSSGLVTIVGTGSTTITLTQEEIQGYTSSDNVTTDISINPVTTKINVQSPFVETYSVGSFNLNATSNSPAPIKYNSDNTDIVTVDSSGLVTIVGTGSTTITLTQEAIQGYTSDTVTTSITINTVTTKINVQSSFITSYISAGTFNLNATTNSPAAINYSSSDSSVVTVNNSGVVTMTGMGSAIITIMQYEITGYTSYSTSTIIILLDTLTRNDSYNSNVTAYPQNLLHRSSNFITMFDTPVLPYNERVKTNFMSSKGTFIYKPHTGYGAVGRSAGSYLACRKRL